MKKQKAIFMLMVMLMSTFTQFATSVEAITAFSTNTTSDFTMSGVPKQLGSSVDEMNQIVTQIENTTFFEENDSSEMESSSVETRATGQDITKYDSASSLPVDSNGNKTIMKLDKMEVKDAAGNVVPVDDGYPLKQGETFTIYYTFEIPNEMGKDIKDGDYFDFQLPTNDFIYLPKAQDGELKGPRGENYGTFHADTDGKVRLTFKNFEQGAFQDVSGTLYFSLGVDTKEVKYPGGHEIKVPNVSGKDDVIIWIAGNTESYVQKKYAGLDGEDPTWEILINPNSLPLKDITLRDTTTQNNSNAIKGIEITKIVEATVDMEGNVTTGSEIQGYKPNADSNGYLDIGMTEINKPYVIYIKTPLNFGVQGEIINRIELDAKSTTGKHVGGNASASFDKTKVELIEKEGKYDKDKQEIEWTITYNPSGLHIPKEDAYFVDKPTYNEYVEGSMTVTPNLSHTVTPDGNGGFKFQFNEDVKEPVTITYTAKKTDTNANWVKNKVTTGEQTVEPQVDTPNGGGGNEGGGEGGETDLTSSVSKKNESISAFLRRWTIDINKEKRSLDKWWVQDTITNGEIMKSTLVLKNVTTGETVDPSDYTVSWTDTNAELEDGATGFKLEYNKATSNQFQIIYEVSIKRGFVFNTANYHYTIEGKEKESDANDSYNQSSAEMPITKSGKFIPEGARVEWEVKINERDTTPKGDNATITDTIPLGQTYVEGSAKAYYGSDRSGNWYEDKDAVIKYDEKTRTLTATNLYYSGGEKLVFETSLDDPFAAFNGKEIKNTAEYDDFQSDRPVTASASLSLANANESLLKKSAQESNKDYVDWKVDINEPLYHLTNVKIIDDSWEHQIVSRESIKLVNQTQGKTLVEGVDYDLDYTERKFVISMKQDVKDHLVLTYRGNVVFPAGSYPGEDVAVKNQVRITSDKILITTPPIEVKVPVKVPDSGGTIIGTSRDLTVVKVDKDNQTVKLSGAEFELYRGREIDKIN